MICNCIKGHLVDRCPFSFYSDYTRDVSPRWVQNFSPQKISFFHIPFSIPSQEQTHHAKQRQSSQKRLQTPQIVLISLNFCLKKPIEHKKIHQALYQYLMDFMANGVSCDTGDGYGIGWVHLPFRFIKPVLSQTPLLHPAACPGFPL